MTPNDDHRSLFLSSTAADAAEDGQRPADGSDEAMRRLRDPFAVTPAKGRRAAGRDAAVISETPEHGGVGDDSV
jgi:hypothetical protein